MPQPSKAVKNATIDRDRFVELLNQKIGGNQRTLSTTQMYYDAFLETLKDEILNGNRVLFRGFGCFSLKTHKSHRSVVAPQVSDEKSNSMPDTTGAYIRLKFTQARGSSFITSIKHNSELAQKIATYDNKFSDIDIG